MGKIAIVYWSKTGNTESMANAVADGVKQAGAQVEVIAAESFNSNMVGDYSAIAFGCPSMGVEVLEEEVFEPMFEECKTQLLGKKIALFGSYGWGNGEWMRNWTEDCSKAGALLAAPYVICMDTPDKSELKECMELGKALV